MLLSVILKKLINNYKNIPDIFASRITRFLHEKNCVSREKLTPSNATLEQIEGFIKNVGVSEGDLIFVHSSWDNLNNGSFSAPDLIDNLLSNIGKSGTLAMPAIPNIPKVDGALFKIKRTPSAAGMLTEVFRRYPNVSRSINLNHSVCAIGPDADYLIRDHHQSETSWDSKSPYYRISEYDNAWILGLGVGHKLKVATSLHCVESALYKEIPYFKKIFKNQVCYKYIDKNGNEGEHCYFQRSGQIYTPRIAKYFRDDELIEETINGLDVYAVKAKVLVERLISLGRQGKTMYVWPIPWPWLFTRS